MAKKVSKKQVKPKSLAKDTHQVGTVVKYVLLVLHIILCWLIFTTPVEVFVGAVREFNFADPIPYMGLDLIVGLIISVIYWLMYRSKLFTSQAIERGIRFILSYVLMSMTVFFYTIAMVRSDQLGDTTKLIIVAASWFLLYALYTASQGLVVRNNK